MVFNLALEAVLMQFNESIRHKFALILFKSFVLGFFMAMILMYHEPIGGLTGDSVGVPAFYKMQTFMKSQCLMK